jgi:hypothetical protein
MVYTDDRPDRRVDRFAGFANEPFVGDKESDFAIVDAMSPLLPWIMDRRSKEENWWKDHKIGKSQGDKKEPFMFDALYTAAWALSYADVTIYYPPLSVYGHPLTLGEVVGANFNSHGEVFAFPNFPENNLERKTGFTPPYPDVAVPGLSLISATAPVYFTGTFQGHDYNDTYVAAVGVDIAVASVSSFLDVLQDSLTPKSFGMLVDSNFNTIVISQAVVERIYPERTGFEEERVTYDVVDDTIIQDRRNQTYMPSDTILQPLIKLDNADWSGLLTGVREVIPGERGLATLDITLTGEASHTEFYVMFEQWQYVADWTLLVFAPTLEVAKAIDVYTTTDGSSSRVDSATVDMEGEQGKSLRGQGTIVNEGNLDVVLSTKSIPSWVKLDTELGESYTLRSGERLSVHFQVSTTELEAGTQSSAIVFDIRDADYPDCFFNEALSIPFSVKVTAKDCGDASQVANANGICVCNSSSVELFEECVGNGILVAVLLVPVMILSLLAIYLHGVRKRRAADSIWEVDPAELKFDDPVKVIGEGQFGLVLLAEYRGTQVAVKRIKEDSSRARSAVSRSSSCAVDLGKKAIVRFDGSIDTMEAGLVPPEQSLATGGTKSGMRTSSDYTRSRSKSSGSAKRRNDFIKEMRLLSKLRHPCVTTVMGAIVDKKAEPMLVMEYMENGSLYDMLHNMMEFEGELILSIFRDVIQGVQFLHNTKPQVIHGDLKAQNILVDSKFRAKVADFGLSDSSGKSGATGTPFWMAPELLRRETANTTASDAYSLGMIVYEIYSRNEPYEGEQTSTVIR